jgi:hypothetical protein
METNPEGDLPEAETATTSNDLDGWEVKKSFIFMLVPSVIAALLLVAKHAFQVSLDKLDPSDWALLAAILLPWVIGQIQTLKLPGGVEVTLREQKREIESMKHRDLVRVINGLKMAKPSAPVPTESLQPARGSAPPPATSSPAQFLLASMFSDAEIAHLENIKKKTPDRYRFFRGLEFELRHLLDMGLIDRRPGKGIRTLQREQGPIWEHFELTGRGREVLDAVRPSVGA